MGTVGFDKVKNGSVTVEHTSRLGKHAAIALPSLLPALESLWRGIQISRMCGHKYLEKYQGI